MAAHDSARPASHSLIRTLRSLPLRPALPALPALAALALGLAGCMVGPDYVAPDTKLPDAWPEALPPQADAAATPDAVTAGLSRWWTAFNDPQLDTLIDQALAGNLDLQRAQTRILQARALRTLAGAQGDPQVNVSGSVTRSQNSANAINGSGVSTGSGSGAGATSSGRTRTLFETGFDALWELDFFGGIRRAEEAADANLASAVENRRAVMVSLVAEVTVSYLDVRTAQLRLHIAQDNLAAQKDSLDLTRVRQKGGLGNDLDVARAEAQWAGTQSTIPSIEVDLRTALHAIDVLLGRVAGSDEATLLPDAKLPPPPPHVPVGLPSDLLLRRPDIRAAERDLAAATASIGVATADLWPKFSLTGTLGVSSEHTSNLFDDGSRFWSLGPGLSWPLLDGGAIRANIAFADAAAQDALLRYRQVVLTAFAETADALVAFGREQERRDTLKTAADSERRAADLARQLHEAGMTDFLDVLTAQTAQLLADNLLALSEQSLSTDYVALCKALGGGWEGTPDAPDGDAATTSAPASAPTSGIAALAADGGDAGGAPGAGAR